MEYKIEPNQKHFATVREYVEKYKKDYELSSSVSAFYYFVLNLFFDLNDEEIKNSITDNNFLKNEIKEMDKKIDYDRGIDAVYIKNTEIKKPEIHLFNFKYTEIFDKTKSHFPSSEVDKIIGFLTPLLRKDGNLKKEVNYVLADKVNEIDNELKEGNPKIIFHLCSNLYLPLSIEEEDRLKNFFKEQGILMLDYISMNEIVDRFIIKDRIKINAKIRSIGENYFDKSTGGNLRALILEVKAIHLIRMILNDSAIRDDVNFSDYDLLSDDKYKILDDAFDENVRIEQKGKINQNIKSTALNEKENFYFFYYNNGITITCDSVNYNPISDAYIELENLQIVNGQQTIRALYDAFKEDPKKVANLEIFCRIYEIKNKEENRELKIKIAEYTNSQNPVNTRDIRAVGQTQILLERQFKIKGYFYERKKNQYKDQPKEKRLDAEKIGQMLISFYNEKPAEAKNTKQIIFGTEYENVFSDDITADSILLVNEIFDFIDKKRNKEAFKLKQREEVKHFDTYILHCSYYLLYIIKKLADYKEIDLNIGNKDKIIKLYDSAKKIILEIITDKFKDENGKLEEFPAFGPYFKSNQLKNKFEVSYLNNKDTQILKNF